MQSFKFIETFFFLSLAITFALIITLVYHFKKRMENMETKCDTMFDIVQNLAKELLDFKQTNNQENPLTSTHQTEGFNYNHLDNVDIDENQNNSYGSDDEDSSDDEDDSVYEEGSVYDNDNVVINKTHFGKITIPDDVVETIVINLSATNIPFTETDVECLVVSENKVQVDVELFKLNDEELLTVGDISGSNDFDTESYISDNTGSISKSALRKLKLAHLRQLATDKQIKTTDAMTKNEIINTLLSN